MSDVVARNVDVVGDDRKREKKRSKRRITPI
jgi:hypothetical protein